LDFPYWFSSILILNESKWNKNIFVQFEMRTS
jgi:hypothetical protein